MNHLKQIVLFILVVLFFVSTGSAQSGYLKLGDIKGESTDAKHKEWIIIESFSQSMSKPGASGATGSTRRRGSVIIEDMSFVKRLDKSSPKLMELAWKGQIIPEVILDITNTTGSPLYKITLSNVMVTSVSNTGSCSSQCELSEQFSLNFEKITWEYTDARGGKVISSYNIETNR